MLSIAKSKLMSVLFSFSPWNPCVHRPFPFYLGLVWPPCRLRIRAANPCQRKLRWQERVEPCCKLIQWKVCHLFGSTYSKSRAPNPPDARAKRIFWLLELPRGFKAWQSGSAEVEIEQFSELLAAIVHRRQWGFGDCNHRTIVIAFWLCMLCNRSNRPEYFPQALVFVRSALVRRNQRSISEGAWRGEKIPTVEEGELHVATQASPRSCLKRLQIHHVMSDWSFAGRYEAPRCSNSSQRNDRKPAMASPASAARHRHPRPMWGHTDSYSMGTPCSHCAGFFSEGQWSERRGDGAMQDRGHLNGAGFCRFSKSVRSGNHCWAEYKGAGGVNELKKKEGQERGRGETAEHRCCWRADSVKESQSEDKQRKRRDTAEHSISSVCWTRWTALFTALFTSRAGGSERVQHIDAKRLIGDCAIAKTNSKVAVVTCHRVKVCKSIKSAPKTWCKSMEDPLEIHWKPGNPCRILNAIWTQLQLMWDWACPSAWSRMRCCAMPHIFTSQKLGSWRCQGLLFSLAQVMWWWSSRFPVTSWTVRSCTLIQETIKPGRRRRKGVV